MAQIFMYVENCVQMICQRLTCVRCPVSLLHRSDGSCDGRGSEAAKDEDDDGFPWQQRSAAPSQWGEDDVTIGERRHR